MEDTPTLPPGPMPVMRTTLWGTKVSTVEKQLTTIIDANSFNRKEYPTNRHGVCSIEHESLPQWGMAEAGGRHRCRAHAGSPIRTSGNRKSRGVEEGLPA